MPNLKILKFNGIIFFVNWQSLLALIVYCGVFVWFTQPLVSNFSTGYIAFLENGDAHQYYWNIFNFKEQICNLKNPFYSSYIFAPHGTSLIMHTYTPIMGIFALLFTNNILALNIFLFLSFILSAFGAFLFCNKLISNTLLSIAAGIVYGFCPYKLLHLLEHYHLLLTAALPFFILCFLKAFQFSKNKFFPTIINKRNFNNCIILGVILFLSDYYAAFSVLYFCLLYALYFKFFTTINYRSLKFWVITFSILLVCHIILHQFKVFGISSKGGLWWSGDLLGYIIPHFNSEWFYNSWFEGLEKNIYHYPGSVEYCMFLGYSVLIILVIFIIYLVKHSLPETLKPFAFLALIFFLMTVPDLKFGGKSIFNLPLSFLNYIPFFNNIRSPTRMLPMVGLFFMPLGLYALSSFLNSKKILKIFASICLILLLVMEYKPKPYPIITVANVPEIIMELRHMPDGILLNVPYGIRDGFIEKGKFNTKKLWYQTIHKKPMVDGYISRLSNKTVECFKTDFFIEMDSMQKNKKYIAAPEKFEIAARYVLIEPAYRKNFEPFFDKCLDGKMVLKLESQGYLLYKLY